ncbi:MAG: dTMP kinase [Victivallaceae bacterium]
MFISIEGGEGSGKTTLARNLVRELKDMGKQVVHTREPGGSPLGEELREILLKKEALDLNLPAELLLFLSSRAQHLEEVILPALHRKNIVICERFHDSTVVYQGYSPNESIVELDFVDSFCRRFYDFFFKETNWMPDITFILEIPSYEGILRKKKQSPLDKVEVRGSEFHKRVEKGFQLMKERYPERIRAIDASKPVHELSQEVLEIVFCFPGFLCA